MDTFNTPQPPRLSVELRAGTVTIDSVETDETSVEVAPLNDSDVTMEALIAPPSNSAATTSSSTCRTASRSSGARRSWPSRSRRRTAPGWA